ncbi:MAG: general secretion pathway protein GspB [Gammaproteobacteria bacterium]|nr:general secretion pathway protein GspB [Gammaproteobacteria bacterium]
MSFILDALKKSETERQQQAGAEFTSVPVTSDAPRAPRWLYVLGALLTINLVVVLGLLIRPDAPRPAIAEAMITAPAPMQPAVESQSFADRVALAKQNQAIPERPTTTEPQRPLPTPAPARALSPPQSVPTIDELRVKGALEIAELHLDIHVYSDKPGDRFVFVNMDKHREGSRLKEGPVVTEITTDGVILDYEGSKFLLPRE